MAATSSVKVTPAEVSALIKTVQESVGQLTQQSAAVSAQANATTGAWTGDAGNTFRQTLEHWLQDDRQVIQALAELEQALDAFLKRIVSADAEAQHLAGR